MRGSARRFSRLQSTHKPSPSGEGTSLNGSTSLTSDASTTAGVPDLLGKNTQDVIFRLDWAITNPNGPNLTLTDTTTAVGKNLSATTDQHFRFEAGITSQPEAATATAVQTSSATPSSPAISGGTTAGSSATAAAQKKATFGGEYNYNAVFAPDQGGTYLELGGLVKGNFDASVEGASTSQNLESTVLTLTRMGTGVGSFRAEVAFRAAIKQYADNTLSTAVTHNGSTTYRKNSDEFLSFEFGYLRDTALSGLKVIGITENRYIMKLLFSPELPDMAGHVKPTLGVEVTGSFAANSAKQVKFIYGVNTSTLRGLFR